MHISYSIHHNLSILFLKFNGIANTTNSNSSGDHTEHNKCQEKPCDGLFVTASDSIFPVVIKHTTQIYYLLHFHSIK